AAQDATRNPLPIPTAPRVAPPGRKPPHRRATPPEALETMDRSRTRKPATLHKVRSGQSASHLRAARPRARSPPPPLLAPNSARPAPAVSTAPLRKRLPTGYRCSARAGLARQPPAHPPAPEPALPHPPAAPAARPMSAATPSSTPPPAPPQTPAPTARPPVPAPSRTPHDL